MKLPQTMAIRQLREDIGGDNDIGIVSKLGLLTSADSLMPRAISSSEYYYCHVALVAILGWITAITT
jgi:hypothetical protein